MADTLLLGSTHQCPARQPHRYWHTRRKPGPQSHGSSPPPRRHTGFPPDATKDPTTAELPVPGTGEILVFTGLLKFVENEAELVAVLSHELAHIRRHDWLVQMGAEALRAVLWFNPLAWIVCHRLRRESEQACDDEVLSVGVVGRDYATHLLALARQCRRPLATWAAALSMAHPSTLERRIVAMLNPRLDRRAPSRRAVATLAGLKRDVDALRSPAIRAHAATSAAGSPSDATALLAFLRGEPGPGEVLAVFNNAFATRSVDLPDGAWTDLLTGEPLTGSAPLPALGWRYLRRQ